MDEGSTAEDYSEVVSQPTTEVMKNARVIQGLFSFEMAVDIIALTMNCFLFLMLKAYRGYHVHLRIFCRHVTVSMIFSSIYCCIRTYYFLHDWNYGESYMIPIYTSFVLCLYPIAIVVERKVATSNFNNYEHADNSKLLEFFCNFTYLPYPILALYYLSYMINPRSSQVACELQHQKTPLLLRDAALIIQSIFAFICSKHFELLIQTNDAATKEYIENNYSSISPRYQLRENSFTCGVMLKFMRVMCVFSWLPVIVGTLYIDNDESPMKRLMQASIWYLSSTPINLIFPLLLLFFDEKLLRRVPDFFKTMWNRMISSPSYLPLCAANACNNPSSFIATTA